MQTSRNRGSLCSLSSVGLLSNPSHSSLPTTFSLKSLVQCQDHRETIREKTGRTGAVAQSHSIGLARVSPSTAKKKEEEEEEEQRQEQEEQEQEEKEVEEKEVEEKALT